MTSEESKYGDLIADWLSAKPSSGKQSIVDWMVTTGAIVNGSDGRMYRRLVARAPLAVPAAMFQAFENQRLRLLLGIPKSNASGKPQSIRVTLGLDTFDRGPVWKMNRASVHASPQLQAYAEYVSREHLRAVAEGDWIVIEDLGSTNGTWIEISQLEVITDEVKRFSSGS